MPNWVDEEGYDWHGKIQCGRCLQRFDEEKGEVPLHPCHGGWFTSYHDGTAYYVPKFVRRYAPGEEEKYWITEDQR